jgi:hypothetical protein
MDIPVCSIGERNYNCDIETGMPVALAQLLAGMCDSMREILCHDDK